MPQTDTHPRGANTDQPYLQEVEEEPSYSFLTLTPALASSRYNRQLLIPSVSLKGQERISSTRVLVIGLGGLGSPASLYLAGAGVGTLGILDHDVVELSNLHRQIIHRETSIGHPPHNFRQQQVQSSSNSPDDHSLPSLSLPSSCQEVKPMTKVQSAARACRELNSSIKYRTHEEQLCGSNALDIIRDYDIVLDCTDNPATRYLISDVCVILGKVLVSGAAQRLDGQIMVLNYVVNTDQESESNVAGSQLATGHRPRTVPIPAGNGHVIASSRRDDSKNSGDQSARNIRVTRGPCYRCVFPVPPSPDMVRGCNEIGILGPVVGTIGCLMASETLRLICRPEEVRKPVMLLYNAWSVDPRGIFRTIGLRGQRPDCPSCSRTERDSDGRYTSTVFNEGRQQDITEDSIRNGSMDYERFCGRVEDVAVLKDDERVSAKEFLSQMEAEARLRSTVDETSEIKRSNTMVVVDVREPFEIELGPKIKDSIHIPISKILRWSSDINNKRSNTKAKHKTFTSDDRNAGTNGITEVHAPEHKNYEGGDNDEEEKEEEEDDIFREILPKTVDTSTRNREEIDSDEPKKRVVFICQRGNDSQIAAQKLKEREQMRRQRRGREQSPPTSTWIGDVKGGWVAIEKVACQ